VKIVKAEAKTEAEINFPLSALASALALREDMLVDK
jgi:hypothetical protein